MNKAFLLRIYVRLRKSRNTFPFVKIEKKKLFCCFHDIFYLQMTGSIRRMARILFITFILGTVYSQLSYEPNFVPCKYDI